MCCIETKRSRRELDNEVRFSPSDIVVQLYRGLLDRSASHEDIKFHSEKLLAADAEVALEELSRDMSNCEEFKNIRGANIALSYCENMERKRRFEHVISFGGHCYTGKLLQKARLKRYSTPFDWTPSNAGMITHCLGDDFSIFLNKKYYEKAEGQPPVHTYYRSHHGAVRFFQHHNPLDDKYYAYIVRAVDRLRSMIRGNAPLMCLLITDHWKIDLDQFSALAAVVSELIPLAKLIGISVHAPGEDLPKFGYELSGKIGEHVLFDYYSMGHLGPLDFDVGLDNVNLIHLLHRLGA